MGVTPKQAPAPPAIAIARIQSLALGMGQATAPTRLLKPHPHQPMPVAEALAALPLRPLQLLPMEAQGMPLCFWLSICLTFHQLPLL